MRTVTATLLAAGSLLTPDDLLAALLPLLAFLVWTITDHDRTHRLGLLLHTLRHRDTPTAGPSCSCPPDDLEVPHTSCIDGEQQMNTLTHPLCTRSAP